VQLISKISNLYVIPIHQRYRQTDRRTDGQDIRTNGRTTCNRKTALCTIYSASRGKIKNRFDKATCVYLF